MMMMMVMTMTAMIMKIQVFWNVAICLAFEDAYLLTYFLHGAESFLRN
jgi:hypothetical protein